MTDPLPHLVFALVNHRKWCRSRGHPFPPVLETVLTAMAASNGQERTDMPPLPLGGHPEPVVAPSLVGDEVAAHMLGVSPRTVRRLRSTGALPAVPIGRRKMIRVADIEAFVKGDGEG